MPSHQIMPPVPARAAINQVLSRDVHKAERVIKLAIGQQSGIGGDAGTVELQLEATVEIEPESSAFRFTRWMHHHRLDPMRYDGESYSSIAIIAIQFCGPSG